MIQENVLAF